MAIVELCVSHNPGCHLTLPLSPALSHRVCRTTCVSDLVSDSGHHCPMCIPPVVERTATAVMQDHMSVTCPCPSTASIH